MKDNTDRIERTVVVRAPRERVWRALTDAGEFGGWFGVKVAGSFFPGARLDMTVTGQHPQYEGLAFPVQVERMEAPRLMTWRWHPGSVLPEDQAASEPMTQVEFRLDEVPDGTRVTVVETGFEAISLPRRARAFEENEQGWTEQVANLQRHVEAAA